MKKLDLILENGQKVQIEVDGIYFHFAENEDKINLNNKVLKAIHDFQKNENDSLDYSLQRLSNAVTVLTRQLVNYGRNDNEHDKESSDSIIGAAYDLSILHESLQSLRTSKELLY
jgi:hypothetical protein